MFHILEEVFQNQWLIHKESALSYLPQLIAYFKGASIEFESKEFLQRNTPYYTNAETNTVTGWEISDAEIPENSVAVIPVNTVIRKYGYSGTVEIQKRIIQAEANPNVISIVFWFETPGGMVANTDVTANMIRACEKPTVGFASTMVASAGMWLYSACDYRIIQSKLDHIGSIGTMASVQDIRGMEDKLGIKMIDIYASLSTRKNEDIRELLENDNPEPIRKRLDYLNEAFHSSIRENLGIKKDSEVFTGKLYLAEEGIRLGLANEINSYAYAIDYASKAGIAKFIKNNYV